MPTNDAGDERAVLLINPRMSPRRNARLPLSLLHLGAVLEGQRPWQLLDGNFEPDLERAVLAALAARPHALVGVTVMPGPQVAPAIAISRAIRRAFPALPVVWGGYFPTLYADAAINAPYVDVLVRGQGEQPLLDLLAAGALDAAALAAVPGITWKRDGVAVHNPEGRIVPPEVLPALPYHRLGDVARFMPSSFLGARTAVHQAALGCRYRCAFCGVVSMWNGRTLLGGASAPERLLAAGRVLRDRYGADSIQLFDHNFFDDEDSSLPMLEALADLGLPWWCYARADTMARFSARTWEQVRRSHLRMVYVGAETASDAALLRMRKGSRAEHTVELVRRCREHRVIPELSFVLGAPPSERAGEDWDPEAEVEATFAFIRRLKQEHPATEIVLYFYSPTPQRRRGGDAADRAARLPVLAAYGPSGPALPATPEEWTEPRWVRWVCHQDAPWLSERLRRRIHDFGRVLACRFPTVQDTTTARWGKAALRALAASRWSAGRYDRPWELALAQRFIRLREPRDEGI